MTDSQQLLAEYARTGSDAAFRELVTRYLNLVYSVALRLVGNDPHRAEDVAQTVFLDLSRTARTLSPEVMLGGWLHRHTCFVAANLMRGERRRQSRERQAVEMNVLHQPPETDFTLLAPILDEAINELGDADRTAILLRFFEQRDFRSVGEALGSNEDAARMRVTRALEKLEALLKQRGVTAGATALSTVLVANAVQSAPVGLAVTISTAAALTGTTLATTATATAAKTIAMTTLQKTLVAATVAVLAGVGIYEARQVSTLRTQVATLQRQQAPLTEQIQQLQNERDETTRQFTSLRGENERLNRNTGELLRLRNEVGTLRQSANQPQARLTRRNSAATEGIFPPQSISFRGATVAQVLNVYTNLSTAELAIDEKIWRVPIILRFENTNALTRSEAIDLFEKSFREQVGIEIIHPETNQTVFRFRR